MFTSDILLENRLQKLLAKNLLLRSGIFLSKIHENSRSCIYNFKKNSGGYTPGPPLNREGKEGRGGEGRGGRKGNGIRGKCCPCTRLKKLLEVPGLASSQRVMPSLIISFRDSDPFCVHDCKCIYSPAKRRIKDTFISSENAPKLTYSNLGAKKFSRGKPPDPQ
jgi:hypothetical protein